MSPKVKKIELRKKIRLGENSPDKDGYLCMLERENLVVECYENFSEDTLLKCSINLNGQPAAFELRVDRSFKDGISYQIHGNVVRNLETIKNFYRDKVREQREKSKPEKKRWKFW